MDTNEEPKSASFSSIQAGGEDAKVWIDCCIGSSPQFHDRDGDRIADLLSGSYDPGELYWLKGAGGGNFETRQTIVGKAGRPIPHHPHQQQVDKSFGSWVSMVDWESDGELGSTG